MSRRVIASIGMPGSGKSTLMPGLAQRLRAEYISSDAVRAELSGDAADQKNNVQVWTTVYERLSRYLQEGKDVVLDSTNARYEDRIRLANHCRESGATLVHGVLILTPLAQCLRWNAQRVGRQVPESIIKCMGGWIRSNFYQLPRPFDSVEAYDTTTKEVLPLWYVLNHYSLDELYGSYRPDP